MMKERHFTISVFTADGNPLSSTTSGDFGVAVKLAQLVKAGLTDKTQVVCISPHNQTFTTEQVAQVREAGFLQPAEWA